MLTFPSCFGLVKHPGSGATTFTASLSDESHPADTQGVDDRKSSRTLKKESTAHDLLVAKGFIPIKWFGKYEADKVSMGTFDIDPGEGGMYGLVFDNTFSKQTSKTATFVVLTYPIGSAPQSTSILPNIQLPKANASQSSFGKQPIDSGDPSASADSLPVDSRARAVSAVSNRSDGTTSLTTHIGTLSKRRRKKGQGYARRFFSLDYSTCTLSYYYNKSSSALRGAIPLSLAAVAADERRREISIDSGAEVWHLRAPNVKEFQGWARALEKASRIARGIEIAPSPTQQAHRVDRRVSKAAAAASQDEDAEWQQVETLVSRVVGTRDALRRLTKEVSALPRPPSSQQHLSPAIGTEDGDGYFIAPEKKSFWRRKSSAPALTPTSALQNSSVPAVAVASPGSATSQKEGGSKSNAKRRSRGVPQEERSLHDHCQALLADLDSVVLEFSSLIVSSKRRRLPVSAPTDRLSRLSMESTASSVDEFFDAEDAHSRVLKIADSDDESSPDGEEEAEDDAASDNSSISTIDDDDGRAPDGDHVVFPAKCKNLAPLPLEESVSRRHTIPPAKVLPPSLIAFVRKNVGKDLSTISMPVSANEPTSLLQKVSEQLEYAQLLDQASKQKSATERLLYITAFAVSQFSSNRAKERAIRKPFNPLLGETFELIRSDKEVPGGFRLLVEKVQHRPVKLALHAESANWSLAQSPAPGQKFWGKSAEITTDGRVRVALRLPDGQDEFYSWTIATMFLRNVVMGEKYVEPVGSMTVGSDSTGYKAVVEFRGKGMFGGRSEEVHVDTFGPDGSDTGHGLSGTWTGGLRTTGSGKGSGAEIWKAGAMVDNAAQTYGMTAFAAGLNEITKIEKDKLPPTDSRLRPDQRLAEEGKLDDAETWKHKLEEAQRGRRRALEDRGDSHKPRWFVPVDGSPDGEEVWKLKTGKDGYWEERCKGAFTDVQEIFKA